MILVTGATGFLGSRIVRGLLRDGESLRAIHRPSSSFDLLTDVRDRIEWRIGDVTNPESIYSAAQGADAIIHSAAHLGFQDRSSRDLLHEINVRGTANVVNAAIASGVDRVLHVSSIAALGRSTERTTCLDESAEWVESELNSEYGKSKYLAELEVRRGIAEGLDAVIVNPSLVMGVGRSGENTTRIVEKIRSGKIPFVPPGSTNVVDVWDVADGIVRAFRSGIAGERYLLAGQNLSWRRIIETLAAALDVRPPRYTAPPGLLKVMGAFFEFGAVVTGAEPVITRETARLAASDTCYENSKAVRELSCSFRPFEETAARIAEHLSNA